MIDVLLLAGGLLVFLAAAFNGALIFVWLVAASIAVGDLLVTAPDRRNKELADAIRASKDLK